MDKGKLSDGKRYTFVIIILDIYRSSEILEKYPKTGPITLGRFKKFCEEEIYSSKICFVYPEYDGFRLFFYGDNKIQEAIDVISIISNKIDFFNKTISLIPYNLEFRAAIGICALIYRNDQSEIVDKTKNQIYKLKDQAKGNEILITDGIYNMLSKSQKRYFCFEKIYDLSNQYVIFKLHSNPSFSISIQETTNAVIALKETSEKFRSEIKSFSKDNLEKIIEIYTYIHFIKFLNRLVLDCSDIDFFSENIISGLKYLHYLKKAEKIISGLISFVRERFFDITDKKLIIIFNGISNQLEWFYELELNKEIEKIEFVLKQKEKFNLTKINQLLFEKNQKICLKLIEKSLTGDNDKDRHYYVKKLLYLYFDNLILYIVTAKDPVDTNDKIPRLKDILWKHLYLFYYNNIIYRKKGIEDLTMTRIPYINRKFEDFLLILGKRNLTDIKKIIDKYSEQDKINIARALVFHINKNVVIWSIENLELKDLWELIAAPETTLERLWLIYKINRKKFEDIDKILFFTCVFERIKRELISASSYGEIELVGKFLEEFSKSNFCVIDNYFIRLDELKLIFKHKLEIMNKPLDLFEKIFGNIYQSIEEIERETDLSFVSKFIKKLKPWIQLDLAKQGFFTIYFICQQKNYYIAKASLKRLNPAQVPDVLKKGILNPNIFFELADIRKFFVRSNTIKLLLKHKLANEKHYNAYKKYLSDSDLKEIKPYVNAAIKILIERDLKKRS